VAGGVAVAGRLPEQLARLGVHGEHAARARVEVVRGHVEPAGVVGGHRREAVAAGPRQRPLLRAGLGVERDELLGVVAARVDLAGGDRGREVDLPADEGLPAQDAVVRVERVDPAAVAGSPARAEVDGAVDESRGGVGQPVAGRVAPDRGARGGVHRVEDAAVAAAEVDAAVRDERRRAEVRPGREAP
jgi:hypothetical protein